MRAEPEPAATTPALRLGMLTPSSNTALEPLTQALLAPVADRVTAHFGRFRVTQIALDDAANGQFREEPSLAAAELLADAKPAVIAWNGTSASWLGFDRDDALCAEITRRTGAPATNAVVSLNRLIAERGVRRMGLVTPYTQDVQARIVANYAAIGVEIVAEVHAGLTESFAFAGIGEGRVADMCRAAAAPGVDAVAVVCTNMRGPMIAAALERETGATMLDSIAVTLWGCPRAAGAPTARWRASGGSSTMRAAPPPETVPRDPPAAPLRHAIRSGALGGARWSPPRRPSPRPARPSSPVRGTRGGAQLSGQDFRSACRGAALTA